MDQLMALILLNHFHSWTEIFIFIQFVSSAGGEGRSALTGQIIEFNFLSKQKEGYLSLS